MKTQNTPGTSGIQAAFPVYEPITTTVQLRGKPVHLHAFSTGTVAVKRNFKSKKGPGLLAKVNILRDNEFTEYLPIWVWVIEHPEGLLVIDTGEIAAIKDLDGYLAKEKRMSRFIFKQAAKFGISPQDELDRQFERLGLQTGDVSLVVLTHLHLDHTDGLKFFPKTEIVVGKTEFEHPESNMPSTYPSWFKPNPVAYQPNRVEVFGSAYPLTQAGDLLYVPTPGHTHGHSSVLFRTDDIDIIFAGDTSYDQSQVIRGELAGVNGDFAQSKATYANLLAYASLKPTLYLPTHDADAGIRLRDRVFLK